MHPASEKMKNQPVKDAKMSISMRTKNIPRLNIQLFYMFIWICCTFLIFLNEPTVKSVKKRLPQLLVLLGLGLLVSSVVGIFEQVVAHLTLIICFQSLILIWQVMLVHNP